MILDVLLVENPVYCIQDGLPVDWWQTEAEAALSSREKDPGRCVPTGVL